VADDETRGKFEAEWGTTVPAEPGLHLSLMFEAMERGEIRSLFVLGENPAQSEADVQRTRRLLAGLDFLLVQDIFMTKTAEMADVVLPAAVGWAESDGTVTSSERRVQRVRKALEAPGEAKDDLEILALLAGRLGHDWGIPAAEEVWDETRSLSPVHSGMSYERLERMGGIQWPCPDLEHPGTQFLHRDLWEDPLPREPVPFIPTDWAPPVDELTDEFPIRLTTGRRLDSYNTGVQSEGYGSPLRASGRIEVSPEDGAVLGVVEGELVQVRSRRGAIEVPIRFHQNLRPGLAFMSIHTPDEADVNVLTVDAWDPQSGTAEFKATAVSIEPIRGN
jgi:formate dehydrogenase major subunit